MNSDTKYFKKLGIGSFVELALLIPKSYENNFISQAPQINQQNCIEVEVLTTHRSPKALSIKFFCKTWNEKLNAVVFRPLAYHAKVFKPGTTLHVKGKIIWSGGYMQLQQPKIIKEINKIFTKYKTTLPNAVMQNLIKKYLNEKNLQKEGLKKEDIENLLLLHFPTPNFLYSFVKKGYPKEVIGTLKFCEVYSYLLTLEKKSIKFEAKSRLDSPMDDFVKNLPFKLTNDQSKTIKEIQHDFKGKYATKRLVMGDVGCGKTIVILASALMCCPKRAVLMVPTTVLAKQIYEEAIKFLPSHVEVGLVVQNSKKDDDLSRYNFIVGTQALLFRELPRIDLVMVDEQHRFGTNQRAKISNLAKVDDKRAHFLQFSATPIPRTLSMMHSSLVDFSYIKELPFKKDIDTKIIHKQDFAKLLGHIKKEIKEGHQTIVVYPLVEESEVIEYQSIEEGRGFWESRFEKVYVTFGKDKNKEEILEEFALRGNILISTTVIEVGISLPKLTTIVLVAPERLGLASLHQLRGRVSRNGLKGYCFLYTNLKESRRLYDFSNTVSGFDIAELDLKYREGGDMLKGVFQSGKSFEWFDMSEDEKILKDAKDDIGYNTKI
ncbi:MAG: ATP-dependent DNA helicase RecG [Sulfurospirillum sp.]